MSISRAVLLLGAVPAAAGAQLVGPARSVALRLDNDLIALRGAGVPPDHDYTHGARITLAWAGAPPFVRRVHGRASACRTPEARRAGCVATAVAVGQEIYTPRRDAPSPVPGERPYGGWLFASATTRVVEPGRARSFGADIGVSGPLSLAEPVQDGVHRLLRNEAQLGWAHQLPTALGVTVRYGEVRRAERTMGRSAARAVALRWGAAAGTVVTALLVGGDVALGLGGSGVPWSPAEPEVERPMRVYALAGYRQDAVLHDAFIDGRAYLTTEFPPRDGGRPYVKTRYRERTPDGRLAGFLPRVFLPADVVVRP